MATVKSPLVGIKNQQIENALIRVKVLQNLPDVDLLQKAGDIYEETLLISALSETGKMVKSKVS